MSCVFGSRLLLGVLRDAGIEADAIGVRLTVADPIANAGGIGRLVRIGDIDQLPDDPDHKDPTARAVTPNGFPGHVVVLARADDRVVLLDPTAFQAIRFWSGTPISPPFTSIVLRLAQGTPLELEDDAVAEHLGWTYEYKSEPHVDWTARPEWVGTDRFRLDEVLRRRVTAKTGVDLVRPADPGRNEPCLCGSGKKYKRCCGANQANTAASRT